MNLISNDLKSLLNTMTNTNTVEVTNIHANSTGTSSIQSNKTNLIKAYLKTRIVSIIVMVVVLLMLVTTSVFTDLGLNIGQALLNFLGF